MKKAFLAVAVALGAFAVWAFPEIPRESSKALGVTRGNRFSSGLVFVNGKFVEPPYCVERWGTGIRVNKIPVTGQVIDWAEFVKTQPGYAEAVAAAAAETPPPEPVPPPAPAPVEPADDGDDVSLDDLFDDSPAPKRKAAPPKTRAVPAAPRPAPKPVPALTGPFVRNDAANALVKKVNAARTEIDRTLRAGGFICFGDGYSRVVGDARAASRLLDALPEIQMRSATAASFRAAMRAAKLDYLHEFVCDELFRNRIDYLKLQEHRERLRKEQEWKKMMEAPKPLF